MHDIIVKILVSISNRCLLKTCVQHALLMHIGYLFTPFLYKKNNKILSSIVIYLDLFRCLLVFFIIFIVSTRPLNGVIWNVKRPSFYLLQLAKILFGAKYNCATYYTVTTQ